LNRFAARSAVAAVTVLIVKLLVAGLAVLLALLILAQIIVWLHPLLTTARNWALGFLLPDR
jgi:hypothetical protein